MGDGVVIMASAAALMASAGLGGVLATWRVRGSAAPVSAPDGLPAPVPQVRLHLYGRAGAEVPSLEGLLLGAVGGEYVLHTPRVVTKDGNVTLRSETVRVPRDQVAFYEVIS